jgi:chromosome segregation ATPase
VTEHKAEAQGLVETVERLKGLLSAVGFTRLTTDHLDRDYDPQREGWRIHDLPEQPSHCAYWVCDGIEEEPQARLFVEGINALPSLLARIEALEAALAEAGRERDEALTELANTNDALERLTNAAQGAVNRLNASEQVREMAATSGGFWAQRAQNAESSRDQALSKLARCRGALERISNEHELAKRGGLDPQWATACARETLAFLDQEQGG